MLGLAGRETETRVGRAASEERRFLFPAHYPNPRSRALPSVRSGGLPRALSAGASATALAAGSDGFRQRRTTTESHTGLHDLRFLPLDRTLLDRAAKAGKTDLNGGTPRPSCLFAEGASLADRDRLLRYGATRHGWLGIPATEHTDDDQHRRDSWPTYPQHFEQAAARGDRRNRRLRTDAREIMLTFSAVPG